METIIGGVIFFALLGAAIWYAKRKDKSRTGGAGRDRPSPPTSEK